MADPNATTCAACGASGELHKHHLVPRTHGGHALPSVLLCLPCHGAVHGRAFPPNHRELTMAGLQAAKARGVRLGNPSLLAGSPKAAAAARAAKTKIASGRAVEIMPHIERARLPTGYATLAEIAAKLTAWGIRTPGGGAEWSVTQVKRVISRAQTTN